MEAVTQLRENLTRLEVVSAAESEAVVEEHAAVGDVGGLKIYGEALAELLTQRKIERRVRLKVVTQERRITIGEAGGVGDVRGSISTPRQSELAANMQRVALIMI